MKSTIFIAAVLSVSGVFFTTQASAACVEEIDKLNEAVSSALIDVSSEARQAAMVERDAAEARCQNGDEAGAAERIANARALLGQ